MTRVAKIAGLVLLVAVSIPSAKAARGAQISERDSPKVSGRPQGAGRGPVVVPDTYLRRWDPLTVFFDAHEGPASGGPEDHPERFLSLTPEHPGSFTWIDSRTLQFRPADPWPALSRFRVAVKGIAVDLFTLMSAPVDSLPEADARGLDPLDEVTLVFPEPLPQGSLLEMTRVELRPLPFPGLGQEQVTTLPADALTIKALGRSKASDPAAYVLGLGEAVPYGMRVSVRLRLASRDDPDEVFWRLDFQTAQPFRVLDLGCQDTRYPVSQEGSLYGHDELLECGGGAPVVVVTFSDVPQILDPVLGGSLLRFSPAVDELSYEVEGRQLRVKGQFAREQAYEVRLESAPVKDRAGRFLTPLGPSRVFLSFPRQEPFLRWGAGAGVLERFGPQQLPLVGRGHGRMDLRIFPLSPDDLSFWPFPPQPVLADETVRPPGPGEEPEPVDILARPVGVEEISQAIGALDTAPLSRIVDLPISGDGPGARFGLDLSEPLSYLSGPRASGHFLVGLRQLDGAGWRSWARIQVTDLSLTTVEEPRHILFVVTSLAKGQPVSGARVKVEGVVHLRNGEAKWETLLAGETDDKGEVRLAAPGDSSTRWVEVRKVSVRKDEDVLVLDPAQPPEVYRNGQFQDDEETWLQWAFQGLEERGEKPELLCHLFPERPVYRPDEKVHLKGYVRRREQGRLSLPRIQAELVIDGPGELSWRYPAEVSPAGSFYVLFHEDDRPAGLYSAWLETGAGDRLGRTTFRLEAYRLPRFQVDLHGPDRVPLDREFEVELTAEYYAGGRVAGRPLRWRVTQFPLDWAPRNRPGFLFSSDGRYSRTETFESRPAVERDDKTDDDGSARILLNPAVEPTALPRSYVVEATVTGADDQTVTATRRVTALPPFVLGLKTPRYLEQNEPLKPEIIAVGTDGELLKGLEVTVRLFHRQWHSYLRASDFSDGVARYITDVVDEKTEERTVVTRDQPLGVSLDTAAAGVYVVELEAHDRVGRAQVVRVDLYAGGDEAVAWSRPADRVFKVTTDETRYRPGETAHLVLNSPFQEARALVIVEAPEGNRYQWVKVRGGKAVFDLPVEGHFAPRLPVHVVLLRGRIEGTAPLAGSSLDAGKPATMAATAWIEVEPVTNRLEVEVENPETALPGKSIPVTVRLKDPDGRPLSGEICLWLVDQAVLALGREQRLDPLPDFLTPVRSHLSIRDTRHLPFGSLPLTLLPGGGEGLEASSVLDRQTVRRSFQPVPYYEPALAVGLDGVLVLDVPLPDNLTNFKIRVKATSGPGRFGYGTGRVAVRLPVIVQPALPRFARPGDSFVAAGIARLVEGQEGPGRGEIRVEGASLEGDATRDLGFRRHEPTRLEFPVAVSPTASPEGALKLSLGVERLRDGAGDAFQVEIPLRPDREPVWRRSFQNLEPGVPFSLPALQEEAREGTHQASLLLSGHPEVVKLATALDFFAAYPYGCTEQRVSLARVHLALSRLQGLISRPAEVDDSRRAVEETLDWLSRAKDPRGLVSYWPGAEGYVSLTAWVTEFVLEAREAGYVVDEDLTKGLLDTLEQALRSDYGHFVDGESYLERAWALAALARGGRFDPAYGSELSRRAQFLTLEGMSQVVLAFSRAGEASSPALPSLEAEILEGVVFRLYQGQEIFGGLQKGSRAVSGLVHPSEARTLAEIVRALDATGRSQPRLPLLLDGLVGLADETGWGSTSANSAAVLALSEVLEPPLQGGGRGSTRVTSGTLVQELVVGPGQAVSTMEWTETGGVQALRLDGSGPLFVKVDRRYVPAGHGSQAAPFANGFVVTRELLVGAGGEAAPRRFDLEEPGQTINLPVGTVVEEHLRIVNPQDRFFVAIEIPLAAGVEPMNPALATAPPEAMPSGRPTLVPTYVDARDDAVLFYYDALPRGTYEVFYRTRASTSGTFTQPPARARAMYDLTVQGASAGARIVVHGEEAPD